MPTKVTNETLDYFMPDLDTLIGDWRRHGLSDNDICRLLGRKIGQLDPEGAAVVAELMVKGVLS